MSDAQRLTAIAQGRLPTANQHAEVVLIAKRGLLEVECREVYDAEDFPVLFFVGADAGAMCTRMNWSPDETSPFQECWVVVSVDQTGAAAAVIVGPYDGAWHEQTPLEFPWIVAATAGAVRASIMDHKPLTPKRSSDHRLFGKVRDGEVPPVDDRGLI